MMGATVFRLGSGCPGWNAGVLRACPSRDEDKAMIVYYYSFEIPFSVLVLIATVAIIAVAAWVLSLIFPRPR
jgi:hypothetical protein